MNEQELEDKILNNTESWINMTDLWIHKVKGDKQKCFNKINSMIDTSQLIMKKEGKEKRVKIADFDNITEFESRLKFQEEMLRECRLALTKVKKPLFFHNYTIVHTRNEQHIKDMLKLKKKDRILSTKELKKKYADYEEVKIWKPRHYRIIKHLESMLVYSNALLLFIDRANMHRTLGIITKSESKRRIEKIEKILDDHFEKLEIETLDDYAGIRQWFYFTNIYKIENFKI